MRLETTTVWMLVLTGLLPVARAAAGQSGVSLAPGILQSVVRHVYPAPPAEAEPLAPAAFAALPPVRSSGAMSGRLAAVVPPDPRGGTTYKSDGAVSAAVRAAFLHDVQLRSTAAAAAAIARSLDGSDPVAHWSALVETEGLRPGDLADALASYWVLNWAMANRADISAAALHAVRDQVRWVVASRPVLRQLSDAEKQAMAEQAMLNFLYEVDGYAQAKRAGNAPMLGRFADGAEMRFRRELSVDLRSIMLSDKGLAARR